MMLLFPAPRISKSFVISYALSPSASLTLNSAKTRKVQSTSMVNYLVDSLGFSKQDAISVVSAAPAASAASAASKSKVQNDRKSKANLVVNLLKSYGLDDSQIRDIVSYIPKILLCKVDTLEPKIRVLRELGLSGSDLVKVMKSNRGFIHVGLHSQIIPGIDFFKKLLGSNEKVVNALIHSRWISSENLKSLSANLLLLQSYGLSKEKIGALLSRRNILHQNTEWFQDKLHYTEVNLGISRDSPMFFYGLRVVSLSMSTINKKIAVFKSFGWSDSEVYALLRNQPFCLCRSEADLRNKLNLFMKEIECTPVPLVKYPQMFTSSLEKRIKPRYNILKLLKEKNLVNEKPSFFSLIQYPEDKFLRFLERFEDEVPNLVETYIISVEKGKKG